MEFNSFELYVFFVSIFVFIFLLDDLFIDLTYFFKKLSPVSISDKDLPENSKTLAIMVANWKEQDVLEKMVHGNISCLSQPNLHLFLGVYPNDTETLKIALKMETIYSNVHTIINSKEGPTYKGQMLNEIIRGIFVKEAELKLKFDGFIMHDSEDILNEKLPQVYELGLERHDFIQTPVLSLPLGLKDFIAGTYLDEFTETHCKELLVRKYLGAAIPSAGVGTCLSRNLILEFFIKQRGDVFIPNSLTEDYQLGLQANAWGFKSTFLCAYSNQDRSEIIATREYFPHQFWSSIKQKTRWTTGIAFQGTKNLGWFGNIWQRYFLWRDRKAPLNAVLSLNIIFILATSSIEYGQLVYNSNLLKIILLTNFLGMLIRLVVRSFIVQKYYGIKMALVAVLRWPFSIIINMTAGLRSTIQYSHSSLTGKKIKWSKTVHRLPENFGAVINYELENIKINETNYKNNDEVVKERGV